MSTKAKRVRAQQSLRAMALDFQCAIRSNAAKLVIKPIVKMSM